MDATNVSASPRPHRLLLVASDPVMRKLFTEGLARQYDVEAVSDGAAAWESARTRRPALVVLDLCAPDAESLTLIRSLREGAPPPLSPILLLAVSSDRKLLLRCLAAGADNFLLKPFGVNELLDFVGLEFATLVPPAAPGR